MHPLSGSEKPIDTAWLIDSYTEPIALLSAPMKRNPSTYLENYLKSWKMSRKKYGSLAIVNAALIALIILNGIEPAQRLISPLLNPDPGLESLQKGKQGYEVFGFAPWWTFSKLDNVDFSTLTTLSYFGVGVDGEGNLDKEGQGYNTFTSEKATEVFKKAHQNGTRVVLTLTQMKNDPIRNLMDNPEAQSKVINDSVEMVKARGIDGINVDLEYTGDPGPQYRQKFTTFVNNLTQKMHSEVPSSRVTVSVYASAVKDPKIYDIKELSAVSDGIFMMAYDFAVAGSNNAIPTSPLYGHKEGKYWYDVSTAVDHFLAQMPSEKLILGVPWYGYNYAVSEPQIKAVRNKGYYASYKKGRRTYSYFVPIKSHAQTYAIVQNEVSPEQEGWDDFGKVGYKAYQEGGTWRMIFMEDQKSLSLKYDFAKDKGLAGVGMWALGFDDGKNEMWTLLKEKFGEKNLAANVFVNKEIK